jgi:branched-chain amino acid aminotransferase
MTLANERIAYFNGKYLPESEVRVPFRDRSWIFGDGAFDVARTFNGRVFKLEEHVERLYRSLKVLRIDPGLPAAEMIEVSRTVLERNLHLLGPDDDYWLAQRISRGVNKVDGDNWDHYGPTVIVECMPLPLQARARLFRDGIDVVVPSVRRVPPDALTPRAKTHNYLNLITADLEVHARDPEAWAVLLDVNGNLCEGLGANIFTGREGRLSTPHERYVLPGVSRATAIELAAEEGIACTEADIDLYDAYTADEIFITSTSFCICPVSSVNGTVIGNGSIPGPITQRLIDAYVELVDCDFVAQYLKHLE